MYEGSVNILYAHACPLDDGLIMIFYLYMLNGRDDYP
jgi:hypothetical protein